MHRDRDRDKDRDRDRDGDRDRDTQERVRETLYIYKPYTNTYYVYTLICISVCLLYTYIVVCLFALYTYAYTCVTAPFADETITCLLSRCLKAKEYPHS